MVVQLTERRTSTFVEDVRDQTGQDARRCYQCGKCTAGCPIAYAMDFGPQRVMRCIQFDMRREVLSSNTIWLCVN